jgi:hypothetical protein
MARLGELLVAAGLLTVEQVEQALRAQVMWGGRLGTNLVELHYLALDPLSKVLGRQHRLPAALARHFEKADPALQRMLSPDLAERFSCVPLLRMGPEQHVVVASPAPLSPSQLAIIAGELAVDVERLVPAIAAELRIRYQLERVYHLRRTARFLRTRGKSIPPFPAFQILPIPPEPDLDLPSPALPISTQEMAAFRPPLPPPLRETSIPISEPLSEPDDLIPLEVVAPTTTGDLDDLSRHDAFDDELAIPAEPIEDEVTARQRRTYVRTIADAPSTDSERQALIGRIAIRKILVGSTPPIMAGATLGEATRAIRRSTSRDRVADLVIDTLDRFAPACEAAIMLVIRGAIAFSWKGFQRSGSVLGELAVPLEDGGLVPRAIERNIILRKPCAELDTIDRLLLASLGQHAGDLVVVPISIADKVMCVIAIATAAHAPIASAEPIAAAAGAAFARMMRDASR